MSGHPAELGDDDQRVVHLNVLHVRIDGRCGGVDRTDEEHLDEGLQCFEMSSNPFHGVLKMR